MSLDVARKAAATLQAIGDVVGSHAGDGHSLSMGRGHGDLSFLLLLGVMPRCPISAKLSVQLIARRAWVVLDLC